MARTDYAAHVMVRLTLDDFGYLATVGLPGEPRAHTFLRCLRESSLPRTCLLRFRKAPLFKDWMQWGPHSPIAAEQRGRQLLAGGFEVEVLEVEPPPPPPAHPDDLEELDDDGQEDDDR